MRIDDDHPYKIFCSWRFAKSLRQDAEFLTNIQQFRDQQLEQFSNPVYNQNVISITGGTGS